MNISTMSTRGEKKIIVRYTAQYRKGDLTMNALTVEETIRALNGGKETFTIEEDANNIVFLIID